jgi:hypothetical protein
MNVIKKWIWMIGILAIVPAVALGNVFIDWRGGFYVTFPDNWFHVPYNSVNIFLQTQNVDLSQFDYDAVLSLKTDKPFFVGPYIFITMQEVGELSSRQIDSVVKSMAEYYGKPFVEGSLRKNDIVFHYDQVIYDKETKTAAIASVIRSEYGEKNSLEIRKFFENGIALFLCYSPTDIYTAHKPTFLDIANSLATKDLDKMAPKENLKVVDLSQRKEAISDETRGGSSPDEQSASDRNLLYIILPIAVILILALVAIRKMKKAKLE